MLWSASHLKLLALPVAVVKKSARSARGRMGLRWFELGPNQIGKGVG